MATGLAMARRSILSAAGFAILIATPVLAQSVPMPAPRPPVAATRAPVTTGSTPTIMAQAQQAQAPAPATNPFAAVLGKTASPGALTPQQRAIIDRVSNYLSSIQVMTGQFVQVGPDGRRSEGEIYIQKPGKLRFEYDPPSPIEIISDGGSVVVRDRKLATQDVYPLSQTPLRFLLADRLDLLKDTNLTAVYADDVFITVVVEETHGIVGKSRMMIMFGAKDTQLKQWTVTDPQGYDTTVAVYNLDFTKRPDPNLFRIDYTQYKN
jgi:outer membrane lipoprotein-sorting protein